MMENELFHAFFAAGLFKWDAGQGLPLMMENELFHAFSSVSSGATSPEAEVC
jgi:hypothetical protein